MKAASIFSGRTAVVTGAGGTLCSAIAIELGRQGAKVALLGRTLPKLAAVADTIRQAGGTALPLSVDVLDEAAVEAACRDISRQLGTCTLLVNGAGGNRSDAVPSATEFQPAEVADSRPEGVRGFFNLDAEILREVIELNLMGTIIPCQVFGREMAREQKAGAIVNFASMNSYRPLSKNLAYAIAKAGIVNLTQWLAAYLAGAGIRVNAIAPGFIANERSAKILMTEDGGLTKRGQNVIDHTPMKRFGQAQDVLGATCWLLDDERAAFVTGITVAVDGGFLAMPGV